MWNLSFMWTLTRMPLAKGYYRVNIANMRRALVLTDESARHPFRASLPMGWKGNEEVENRRPWRVLFGLDASDMRQFAANYVACFLAVTVFIA